jgi:hypothetical protein
MVLADWISETKNWNIKSCVCIFSSWIISWTFFSKRLRVFTIIDIFLFIFWLSFLYCWIHRFSDIDNFELFFQLVDRLTILIRDGSFIFFFMGCMDGLVEWLIICSWSIWYFRSGIFLFMWFVIWFWLFFVRSYLIFFFIYLDVNGRNVG